MPTPDASPDGLVGTTPLRALFALVVSALLALVSLGYHDGAFGTEDVAATDLVMGTFRFKGTIESWDPMNQTFRLRDDSGAREFQWNITQPEVGRVYVVDADVGAAGGWRALALTRILIIEGTWT